MNIRQPKCLIYAKSQYPELEPVDGLRMLAKLHTSREIAELCGSSWATVATRCSRLKIRCIEQDKKTTSKNIRAGWADNEKTVVRKLANYITKHHKDMKALDALKMLLATYTANEIGKMIGAHRTSVVSFCEIRKLDYKTRCQKMKIKSFICELCRRETMMKDESLMTGKCIPCYYKNILVFR